MQINIINYLKDSQPEYAGTIDLLEYEINKRIYHYGRHFATPKESYSILFKIKSFLKFFLMNSYKILQRVYKFNLAPEKCNVVSNAYAGNGNFSLNQSLINQNLSTISPPWAFSLTYPSYANIKLLWNIIQIDYILSFGSLRYILSKRFYKKIALLDQLLEKHFRYVGASALIVPHDLGLYERMAIDIFKRLQKPTFFFRHGLPGRYIPTADDRTDYLLLWGDNMKQNYLKIGFPEKKLIVVGHPGYTVQPTETKFFSSDILIITKGVYGSPSGGKNEVILSDRGNLLVYLFSIEKVLRGLGIKKVRLRVHPSENSKRYEQAIDTDFFRLDTQSLSSSLKESTLVIGPTSSILLEALYSGVNYVIYEPMFDNKDMYNHPIVQPFDGSDKRIPVAHDEDALKKILETKETIDISCLKDYIEPLFDVSKVASIIGNN